MSQTRKDLSSIGSADTAFMIDVKTNIPFLKWVI